MIDTGAAKQAFKDLEDDGALDLYRWVTVCMEVRGLIPLAGAKPTRKRRSDAGQPRTNGAAQSETMFPEGGRQA